jgi:hypothetical protein
MMGVGRASVMTAMKDSRPMRMIDSTSATYSRMCRRERKGIWSAIVCRVLVVEFLRCDRRRMVSGQHRGYQDKTLICPAIHNPQQISNGKCWSPDSQHL